jgi:hypothetical protein
VENNMKKIRLLLAAFAASAAFNANASQYTDLWFNPQESGWGMNVVQQQETAFVTLFVYGPDGKPTWYVASNAKVIGYVGAFPVFEGTLYRTEGPWHGGPFDPARVGTTAVGTLSLEVKAKDRIRVQYTAEGVAVSRDVSRFTWSAQLGGGNFLMSFNLREATPGGTPVGTLQLTAEALMLLTGDGIAVLRAADQLGRLCEYRGPYAQTGKLGAFSGSFTCTAGNNGVLASAGTFEVSDLEVSSHGVTGYLRSWSTSANHFGRFGGALM